jgi:hypothetical protein
MKGKYLIDQSNTVFRNLGGRKFEALTAEAGFDALPAKRHRGSAWGDLNGDGRIDLVVSALSADAEIWMNDGAAGAHWIQFALRGTKSNRDGIGAKIKIVTAAGTQYNHATTSVGYASSSGGPVHFGLGSEKTVKRAEIRWPSGVVQTLENLDADRIVAVTEPR